jgi:hypothetical protein
MATVDDIVNSFPARSRITSFSEFEGYMAEFCKHAQKCFLNLRASPSQAEEIYKSLYSRVAERVYGENGWKRAYGEVLALNGNPLPVAKKIAEGMQKHNMFY